MVILNRLSVFAILLSFATGVSAQQSTLAVAEQDSLAIELNTLIPTLIASPSTCELKQPPRCKLTVSLIWEVPKAGHFCLWQQSNGQLLNCWQNVWSGTYAIEIDSEQSLTFYLTRTEQGQAIATTTVAIISPLEQRLRAKRRRGFWRLF